MFMCNVYTCALHPSIGPHPSAIIAPHAYMHLLTIAIYVCMYTCVYSCIGVHLLHRPHAYRCIHTHMYIHTHIHAHIHAHLP